jgi:hypothetical protein
VASIAAVVEASELGRPVWPGIHHRTTYFLEDRQLAQFLITKTIMEYVKSRKLTLNERTSLV